MTPASCFLIPYFGLKDSVVTSFIFHFVLFVFRSAVSTNPVTNSAVITDKPSNGEAVRIVDAKQVEFEAVSSSVMETILTGSPVEVITPLCRGVPTMRVLLFELNPFADILLSLESQAL